jgi:hypothetical protein
VENLVSASVDPQKAQERSAPTQNADSPTAQRETTTIEAAAARLGIGRSLGYQLARENRFPVPVIRAGRRLLVPTAALERVLSGESALTLAS